MLATIKFVNGDLEQGLEYTLTVAPDGQANIIERNGRVPPPNDPLDRLYDERKRCHDNLPEIRRIIRIPDNQTYECTVSDSRAAVESFLDGFRKWLDTPEFRVMRGTILEQTPQDESLRVLIETSNNYLRKFPWHCWSLFEARRNAEFALSSERSLPSNRLSSPVKILAILGNTEGINVDGDRSFLENLPGAEVEFLVQPAREMLFDELFEHHWNILFFAGHSSSDSSGRNGVFQINSQDSVSVEDLHFALRRAVDRGLKAAFFNSCDGLGLVDSLASLRIPHMIVMAEAIPDEVAQEFLRRLLESFSQGNLFHLAVRDARERLQGMEGRFPGASCLPVIIQNPVEMPLTYPSPPPPPPDPIHIRFWRWIRQNKWIALVILSVLAGIMAVLLGREHFDIYPDGKYSLTRISENDMEMSNCRQENYSNERIDIDFSPKLRQEYNLTFDKLFRDDQIEHIPAYRWRCQYKLEPKNNQRYESTGQAPAGVPPQGAGYVPTSNQNDTESSDNVVQKPPITIGLNLSEFFCEKVRGQDRALFLNYKDPDSWFCITDPDPKSDRCKECLKECRSRTQGSVDTVGEFIREKSAN